MYAGTGRTLGPGASNLDREPALQDMPITHCPPAGFPRHGSFREGSRLVPLHVGGVLMSVVGLEEVSGEFCNTADGVA